MIAAWHDVECASYDADLALWRELADLYGSPILDIGAGTGRVAFELAARGHEVTALDADPELVAACGARARERSLTVEAVAADARSFDLGRRFALSILPMQVAQLLGGSAGRLAMLARVRDHLAPGGAVAIALADPFGGVPAGDFRPPLPDVLEVDGWVLSSSPVAVRDEPESVAVDRHRQAVSPEGELTEEVHTLRLDSVAAATMEAELRSAGFTLRARRSVPETRDYVGAVVPIGTLPA